MKLGLYRHYKGNLYQVIGVARHSENLDETYVVYQCLYGNYGLWIRPYKMFQESVQHQGKTVARFEFLTENLAQAATVK